jgi:hypothetical protein
MSTPSAEEPKGDAAAAAAVPNPAETPIETPIVEDEDEENSEKTPESEVEDDKSEDDSDDEDEDNTDEVKEESEDDKSEDESEDDKDEDEDEDEDEDDTLTQEEVDLLLNSDKTLSEDFKKNAKVIFKQKLDESLKKKTALLEKNFSDRLESEVSTIQTKLAEQVSEYMDYAIREWVEKNQVAIEHGLRTEIAENFIESLKNVFKENYITVPEGKTDLVESYETEISKLMDATTWFTATECLMNGLCDEIEESVSLNKPRIKSEDVRNAYKEATLIINSFNKYKK